MASISESKQEGKASALKAEEEAIVTATAEYGELVHASVEKDNIFACQFHPEKSSEVGLTILKNFINIKREEIHAYKKDNSMPGCE